MKKKIAVLITTILVITAIAVPVVFADENSASKASDFFKSMFDFKRNQVNEALKSGDITEDDAKKWNEHFDYMEKFHEENGFYGPGHCGGFGAGQWGGPNNQSYGPGFSRGMMGGYYYNNGL